MNLFHSRQNRILQSALYDTPGLARWTDGSENLETAGFRTVFGEHLDPVGGDGILGVS
jgi:hypothetical protein